MINTRDETANKRQIATSKSWEGCLRRFGSARQLQKCGCPHGAAAFLHRFYPVRPDIPAVNISMIGPYSVRKASMGGPIISGTMRKN